VKHGYNEVSGINAAQEASGSLTFEDILDSDGGVIGTLDFANPVIFKVINCSVNALQCDASELSADAEIEITSL